MAYAGITLPLTGPGGDVTGAPAVDVIGGLAYQAMKLVDGLEGATSPVRALGTTPDAADVGMVVRPIGSTAHPQAVTGTVDVSGSVIGAVVSGTITVGNPTTAVSLSSQHTVTVGNPTTAVSLSSQHTVTAALASAATTGTLGQVAIANPTTSVSLSSAIGITSGSSAVELTSVGSTRQVGTVNQGTPAGTSADAWWVRTVTTGSAGGSTSVDLASGGSTKVVGTVNQGTPAGTSADAWWVRTVTTGSAGGSTTVDLGSGGSTKVIGQVALTSAGTTATLGQVAVANPATAVSVTSGVVLGGSTQLIGLISSGTQTIGSVNQGAGSSASSWFISALPFSSANVVRSSVATSIDVQIVAADTTRKAMTIGNRSTAQTVGIGFSTSVVTTALANVDIFLPPSGSLTFGMPGGLPLYRGPLRAINLTSTAVAGSVSVVQFG